MQNYILCTASMLGMSPNSRYPQSSCNTVDKLLSHKDKDDRERRILSRWLDSTKLSYIWDTGLTYVHEIYTMERFHVRKRMLTLSNSCLMYVPSEITGYVPSSITGWSHWGTHYVCAHNCITPPPMMVTKENRHDAIMKKNAMHVCLKNITNV